MAKKKLIIICLCILAILLSLFIFIIPLIKPSKNTSTNNDNPNTEMISNDSIGTDQTNEEGLFYDERTGKEFELTEAGIKVYLPEKLTYKSKDTNFKNEVTYDDKNRITNFKGFKSIYDGGHEPDFRIWDIKYVYNLENHFDRMYTINCNDKRDYSFEYEGNNIVNVIDNFESDKTYYTYTNKGMFLKDNIISNNTISYGSNNLITKIIKQDTDTVTYEYAYDQNNEFIEMVGSEESDRGYVHYNNTIKRQDEHIISCKYGFNYEIDDMNELYLTYDFEYNNDKLAKVTIDDVGQKDPGLTFKYDENGVLNCISKKDKYEKNKQLDYIFTFDNDQIKEINLNNGEEIITIDYKTAYIDMDTWNSYYKDYYYCVRYESV